LVYSDFEVKKRQCIYGGHLIKIIGSKREHTRIQDKVIEAIEFFHEAGSKLIELNDLNFDILFYDQI
jgi:hypothetical protein